jgi:hypothetical protein
MLSYAGCADDNRPLEIISNPEIYDQWVVKSSFYLMNFPAFLLMIIAPVTLALSSLTYALDHLVYV